jgi:PAS domain S-box-containing protein
MATILIVDDLATNRTFLVTVLRHHGHRLIEAADGREGLAAVRADRPDLIITDVLMPVMDGYELVKQLRLDPATSGIPVVFYTAHYGEREARALARSSGVAYVLTKPAASADVLAIVDHVLDGESEMGGTSDATPLSTEIDREHLRLVTDKLSEKSGDLKTANARLRALINIGLELASERNSGRLLHSVCVAARDLFGATYITLGLVDRNDGRVDRVVTCGDAACGTAATDWIKTGDAAPGILGTVVAERRTLRGDNRDGDPAGLQLPSGHPAIHAFLAAPIVSPARVYGWMCLVGNEGRPFTEEDEHLVMALSGQVGRIYELEQEIVERQQAESAARHERDRAQRYLDTAQIILLALDTEGRITLANRYACSILGWTTDELYGRDWVETCVPERIRTAIRNKLRHVTAGDLSVVENPILTRSGEERLIEWRNTVLQDADGRVTGTFSSGADKAPGKGTGLGLATIHDIVAGSGGRIDVSSDVGKGSSFKVCFPTSGAAAAVVEAPPVDRPRAAETVLVVDDSAGLRELTRRLLQRLGYTVLVAANADEALGVFEQNASVEVLLTDVVMPGGSGPELTQQLMARHPALKVIYMSGYTEDAIVQHGVVDPGIAFLHKPFTSATLGQKIREVLDRA